MQLIGSLLLHPTEGPWHHRVVEEQDAQMELICQITQIDSGRRGPANLRHLRNQRHLSRLLEWPRCLALYQDDSRFLDSLPLARNDNLRDSSTPRFALRSGRPRSTTKQ
jgi:hypothetical protein